MIDAPAHQLSLPGLSKEEFDALPALKCVVSYNRYGGYCIPVSSCHRPAAQMVLANDVYEPDTIRFILAHCGQGDIVHAGTYFGDFLPALARGLSAGAKVWAWEPNLENYRCAEITLLLNDLRNVQLSHAALGDRREKRDLLVADADGNSRGGSSMVLAEGKSESGVVELTQMETVDDAVPVDRTVSILQLDVEGHERAALAGALKTIRRCRPIIMVEVLDTSTLIGSKWFDENILALGYRASLPVHGNAVFICDATAPSG